MSFNRFIGMGNLTRDPEVRHLDGGNSVCNFGIAMNRRYKTKDGEQREDTCFIDCAAWGSRGEAIAKFFGKGKQILVEGELRTDQWEDKDGKTRSKNVLNVTSFSFTGPPDGSGGGGSSAPEEHQDDDINF